MTNDSMTNDEILKNNLDYTIFSWSKQSGLNPLNIKSAKGVYLYDRNDKKILDFSSQLMNMNIGHGHPRVKEAVMRQMDEVSFVHPGMITKARGELGKKLAEITPGSLKKTFFTNAGAEAIENAVKFARLYTGRHKIVSLYQSYHGASYGAMSVGGDPRKLPHDSQQSPNFIHVENPYFYRCPWNSATPEACTENALAHMERIIKYEGPGNVAAILMEGESGSSGCIKYPAGYWKGVRAIADKYGILLIADEVMSGFGRTGKWFGVDHHGVVPDIMCFAKGLTCGYIPLGGMIVKEELINHFNDKPLPLGLTYSAHAVACAAAVEVLKIYVDENLIDNASKMGAYMTSQVEKMKGKHPSIGDFRTTGLLGCVELVKNRDTKEPMAPWNASPSEMDIMNKVNAKLVELGLFTFVRWNYIFTCPPLCITKDEMDEGLEIISKAIAVADNYCN
ncbi:MAG: aminotransferase class III-fold pyridoxal phosphate-dependent enzyme [Bacteroidetes bacterium]|nr:aminotransferase class III-fold pyridoxal phosphate-dependent enzyme [Bacteroidota bacterium]